ncbi:MAG: alpha/beta hydrolase [Alphaproteobacteria bacterium]
MIGALRALMAALWLLGLSACAPSAGPGPEGEVVHAGAWRHWQPAGVTTTDNVADDHAPQPAASGPKAVILALHGFNDYSNAFQDFAAFAREHGIAVHAYDQQGFGVTANRGRWPGTDALVRDLRRAVAELRAIYGETPLYVLGESMGGAVAIAASAREGGLDVDGLILSAPAVWGGKHMNLFYRLTLWLAATVAPGWELTPPEGLEIWPSDNIEMLRAFSADPLVIKATRTDAVAGLVALMDEALAAAPKLDQDILLLIGEKDEIVPTGALDDFHGRLQTARATAIRYPEGYHMLLRDLQRARVYADIESWIERLSETGAPTPPTASARLRDATKG